MIEEGADGQPSAPFVSTRRSARDGMKAGTWAAIYFVVWWTVLFVVLPIRVKTQGEAADVVPGTTESAPENPALLLKAGWTTVISVVVCLGLWALMHSGLSLDDIPFLPRFSS